MVEQSQHEYQEEERGKTFEEDSLTTQSKKRFKPISSPPNTIFIIYIIISFLTYHLIGTKYHNLYTFIMFMVEYTAYSSIPIAFVVIYNIKKGKTVFGIISIAVSILFILIAVFGTYQNMYDRNRKLGDLRNTYLSESKPCSTVKNENV